MRRNETRSDDSVRDILLCSTTQKAIRSKARKLVRRAGFSRSDLEDIEHDLYLKLLKQLPAFDESQLEPRAFVKMVLDRYATNILRDRCAEKRHYGKVHSLNTSIVEEDGSEIELIETISEDQLYQHLGGKNLSAQESLELKLAIAEILPTVSNELQRVLLKLMEGKSVAAVARETGIPRTTLIYRIQNLRKRFEEVRLKKL